MRLRPQFRIRTLLALTAFVAVVLAALMHYRRWERLARMHARQAVLVAESRQGLLSVSFYVPPQAWHEYDRQETLHRQLAAEYRRKIWQPWLRVTQPDPPLPIEIEHGETDVSGRD